MSCHWTDVCQQSGPDFEKETIAQLGPGTHLLFCSMNHSYTLAVESMANGVCLFATALCLGYFTKNFSLALRLTNLRQSLIL